MLSNRKVQAIGFHQIMKLMSLSFLQLVAAALLIVEVRGNYGNYDDYDLRGVMYTSVTSAPSTKQKTG